MFLARPLADAFERCPRRPDNGRLFLLKRMYGFTPSYARYATHRAHSLSGSGHHDPMSAQYCFAK